MQDTTRFPRHVRAVTTLLLLSLILILSGCGAAAPTQLPTVHTPVRVVVTTMQLADFTQVIAGDSVTIEVMMKEGINHHTYEPTVRDIKLLKDADVVIINGVGLDSWIKDLLRTSGSTAILIDSSAGIKTRDLLHSDHIHEGGDPHIWHDPENAKQMVTNITQGLSQVVPAQQATFTSNAAAYAQQIDQLTSEIRAMFAPIPRERRTIVTSHEAFGYFARQFELTMVATITIASDSTEPSQQQILALVEKIKDRKVTAIFTETTIDPRLAEQIAAEANVPLFRGLYSDSMGGPGSDADTYLMMMRHNARLIADGLK
jgi:zinc/manganese transport system substrate-binding protein